MQLILPILRSVVAVVVLSHILKGIQVDGYWSAVIVAIVLALLNVFVKPILVFLTLPATIITLGLFLLVINAVIILIAGELIEGFRVYNFWWALLFSLLLSLLQSVLFSLLKED